MGNENCKNRFSTFIAVLTNWFVLFNETFFLLSLSLWLQKVIQRLIKKDENLQKCCFVIVEECRAVKSIWSKNEIQNDLIAAELKEYNLEMPYFQKCGTALSIYACFKKYSEF